MKRVFYLAVLAVLASAPPVSTQQTVLPRTEKIRNYLPHMTVPEVQDLLTRSDMVVIPVASLEQHGLHLPIGTDYLNGVARAQLIAQQADVLVAPILLPGQSPYHMGFEGTITLPSTLIQEVYVEAAKSLMRHGVVRAKNDSHDSPASDGHQHNSSSPIAVRTFLIRSGVTSCTCMPWVFVACTATAFNKPSSVSPRNKALHSKHLTIFPMLHDLLRNKA